MKKLLTSALLLVLAVRVQGALVNVALDAPAYVNGALFGGDVPARLTDGLSDRQIHGDAAPPVGFAYWIDLGVPRAISEIRIWPRQDNCCGDRFRNVRVSVHNDDGLDNIGDEVWHADLYTDGTNPGSAPGTVVSVTGGMGTGTFTGRWVKLTALGDPLPSYALQVNELEVIAPGTANVALGAAVRTSAPIYSGRSPSELVNGFRGTANIVHGDATFQPYDPLEMSYRYEINFGALVNLEQIKIIARQDGCCPERLSNYRVSIHEDEAGEIGTEIWAALMHTDLSNPGSGPGAKDVLTADFDPFGTFAGQWLRISSLDNPVPPYALQMTEVEVYGTLPGGPLLRVVSQPQKVVSALGRTPTLVFAVAAVGGDSALITYQWQKNGVNISGATSNSYTTPPLTTADETNLFRCVASYPGLTSTTSDVIGVDLNYAFGAAAFANGPLWGPGGWSIGLIVDGNHDADGLFRGVHGDVGPPLGFAYWFDMHTQVNVSNVVVWARQDTCCVGRLTNYRLSIHDDDNGAIGAEVWGADLHTDGSNAGGGFGARDLITGELDPVGTFSGRWVKITSLANPVPDYALQLTEIEVFGSVPPETKVVILQQPTDARSSPFRTATFTTSAGVLNGEPGNLHYQWLRNGVAVPGATATSYTVGPLCADDAGSKYRCVISYPGIADTLTDEATLVFDYNYARGSQAYANRPLWLPGGWNISMLVDGNRSVVFHGDENIEPGFAYTVNMGFPVDIEHIDIYPRQDNCSCSNRFTNLRVSVHNDSGAGTLGAEVWGANLFTDGSNPGAAPGTVVTLVKELDPLGTFSGQWVKVESLENPVQNYALQMTELEVIGKARALCFKIGANGNLTLSWDHGTLLSSPNIEGPFTEVPNAVSPLSVSFIGAQRFYRLRVP